MGTLVRLISLWVVASTVMANATTEITASDLKRLGSQVQTPKSLTPDDLIQTLSNVEAKAVVYTAPSGRNYPGMILPNGRVAPALVGVGGKKTPACILDSGELVSAKINEDGGLNCRLVLERARAKIEQSKSDEDPKFNRQKEQKEQKEKEQKKQDNPAYKREPTSQQVLQNRTESVMPVKSTQLATYALEQRPARKYGISIGTWGKAKLKRSVTSSDNGQVELEVLQTISGKNDDLLAGTLLFCDKRFNVSAEVLDMTCQTALTPDGDEFSLSVTVYRMSEQAGLTGRVDWKVGETVRNSATRAGAGLVSGAAASVNPYAGDVVGDVASNTTSQSRKNTQAVIFVSPQDVLFRVDRSF